MNIETADKDNGVRPAGGSPNHCFYCGNVADAPHKHDCVIPQKAVVVRRTMEFVISVPRHWDSGDIEFHRNDSSSCADNDLNYLIENHNGCTCSHSKTEYLREAGMDDLRDMPRTFSLAEVKA